MSSMGVTGQEATFHRQILEYLTAVKKEAKIPVMMGFGIRTAEDVRPMKEIIDGAIVGSHFITLMRKSVLIRRLQQTIAAHSKKS